MVVRIYLAVLGIACAANRFVRSGSFAAGAAFRFTGLAYGASVGVLIIPAARPVAPSVVFCRDIPVIVEIFDLVCPARV